MDGLEELGKIENMNRTMGKLILSAGLFGTLLLACILFLATRAPAQPEGQPPYQAKPKITWTPSSLNETILSGSSKTIAVSFSASQSISDVVLRVVPELRPYVRVSPQSFGTVVAGQTVAVTIIISVPDLLLPSMFQGTIQLRNQERPANTLAEPLPVSVNVEWQTFTDESLGLSISLPPTFAPIQSTDPNLKQVVFSDSPVSQQKGIAPVLLINILDLAEGQSLIDFIQSFGVSTSSIDEVNVGGRQFLRWRESAGESIGAISYSMLFSQSQVVTVSTPSSSFATSPAFLDILSSLTFP